MKNIEIKKEVFSLKQMDVTRAYYKDSEYFIAGGFDITDYVNKSHSSDIKSKIQEGLDSFFLENPNPASLKKYNLYLLKDSTTPFGYICSILADVFRKSDAEAYEMTDHLVENGSVLVSTFDSFEFARTFASMIEVYNEEYDKNLVAEVKEVKELDMVVLERLINRDHPED